MRCAALAVFAGVLAFAGAPRSAWADPDVPSEVTPAIRASAAKAIKWLVAAQNPNGSWGLEPGTQDDIGCTCVATLCLMGNGSTSTRGPHATQVAKAIAWVMRTSAQHNHSLPRSTTSLISRKLGNEIEGFLATLLLAEALGTETNREQQEQIRKAVATMVGVISAQQREDGSWNSQVFAPLLATASAWMSLRTAYMAGIPAGSASVQKTLDYVKRQLDPKTGVFHGVSREEDYRFYGQACGLRVLFGMGLGEDALTQKGVQALFTHKYKPYDHQFISEGENYMAAWYSTQSLFQDPSPGRALYFRWYKEIAATLLGCQDADGSWRGTACITSRVFSTSCAVLTLQVPLRTLPMTEY